jgi:protein-tyrosine phosphatase
MTLAAEAPRLLPLEGGFNLRDLGGYATVDGCRVKRGVLFRSGTMAFLTAADEAYLQGLGIATVCDMRRPNERSSEPTRWCATGNVHYWSRDYGEKSGALAEVVRTAEPTVEAMVAAMLANYRAMPRDHAPAFAMMFDRLGAGQVPLLFNCSAGKDRTGVAAALILHALGVPYETILADYLLTNAHADFAALYDKRPGGLTRLALRAPEVAQVVLDARADYLETFYAELDQNFGGIDRYLEDRLGVDDAARDHLRATLTD